MIRLTHDDMICGDIKVEDVLSPCVQHSSLVLWQTCVDDHNMQYLAGVYIKRRMKLVDGAKVESSWQTESGWLSGTSSSATI